VSCGDFSLKTLLDFFAFIGSAFDISLLSSGADGLCNLFSLSAITVKVADVFRFIHPDS
jgi:hypothetical protein